MTELPQSTRVLELGKEFRLQSAVPLTIIATDEHVERLKASTAADWIGGTTYHAIDLDGSIREEHLNSSEIVIVQMDPSVPESMGRIGKIHALRPDMQIIVALDHADMRLVRTLVREGVSDVVSLPLQPEEILQAALAILEVRNKRSVTDGRLISVTRAIGGTGATTLVTHLARHFAQDGAGAGNCCIIDLDIQFGRVAEVLGVSPKRNLGDLLEAGDRLDGAFFKSIAVESEHGVAVLAAPQEIAPLEAIDPAQLRRILDIARQEYEFVFVDLPSNLANWTLSLLAQSDLIVMLVEQSIPSLRQARRRIDLFKSVGLNTRNIEVVVNRIERRLFSTISLADVAQALGVDVTAGLALDAQNIPVAQDQGVLVDRVRSKSRYAQDVAELAQVLRDRLEAVRAL